MTFRRGERVKAVRSLGMLGGVSKGEIGTVREVSFLGTYTVEFRGGRVLRDLKRDDLTPVGGCLLLTGLCLALAALALVQRRGPVRSSGRTRLLANRRRPG